MNMTQETKGEVVIFRLAGQLVGGADADRVREQILAALSAGHKRLLIDLKDVSWVNSTGLGFLISSHLSAVGSGATLALMQASHRIESILGVTRLNTIFQLYQDEESALLGLHH
jgi:anti-sigma B factor antagonist